VKELIIDMSLNASGVRDTARSLHISTNTVLSELKKKEPALESVNTCGPQKLDLRAVQGFLAFSHIAAWLTPLWTSALEVATISL
jgi:hypothetical protein